MDTKQVCGYCHADSNGQYDMFAYEHPTRPQRSAAISFYGGELTVDINHPEEPITHRLSCKINYCPFCGRAYTEEDDNECKV